METMGDGIQVNDGKGFWDSDGIIDTLIVDCNSLTKLLIENQFVAYGNTLVQMVQKMNLLKKGIKDDRESLQEQIDRLKQEAETDA